MTGVETSLAALVATPIGKKITNTVFNQTVKFTNSFIDSFKKKNKEEKSISRYLAACDGVRKFRTIGYSSRDVNFDEIYVPLNITSSANTKHLVTDSLELESIRPINILGRAGQGKSTILRRLFLNMVDSHTQLPFFFELKYFKEDSLEKNLVNEFKKWGFTFDEHTVLEFISRREVTLFLDAFDEVPTNKVNDVLEQITRIKNTSTCNLIITSRPNTPICFVENIDTFKVDDLTRSQVFSILRVVCASPEQFSSLKQAITSKEHVLQSIVSPILVVLLQIVYSHSNSVPHSLNDFYNRVFLTLFHRHDELKTNVERGFKTNLTCDQSEKVFQAFCYLSLKNNDLSFSKEIALIHMEQALTLRGFGDLKAEDYFHDIFHVTNIIQEDGYDNYSFFHRSLQEFYAYKFIKGYLNTEQQQKFFEKCLHDPSFGLQFTLVLSFFDDDTETSSYLSHYYLPLFGEIVGVDMNYDLKSAAEKLISSSSYIIQFTEDLSHPPIPSRIESVGFQNLSPNLRKLFDIDFSDKQAELEGKHLLTIMHDPLFESNTGILKAEVVELLKHPECQFETHKESDNKSSTLIVPGHTLYHFAMTNEQRRHYLESYCNVVKRANLLEVYKKRLLDFNLLKEHADRILFDGLHI